jgi:hypothetical protein
MTRMTQPRSPESTGGPDPQLRLTLFGGGHGADCRETGRQFGEWVGREGNVPMLAAPGRHPADVERDVDRLAGHLRDVRVLHVTVRDAPRLAPDLDPFAGTSEADRDRHGPPQAPASSLARTHSARQSAG